MKIKAFVLTLACVAASGVLALAQTDAPAAAADKTQPTTDTSAPATAATPASAPAEAAPTIAANSPTPAAPEAATNSPAPATAPAAADATATNSTATATNATATAAPDAAAAPSTISTNGAARDPNAVIPLIVMDEVPLTDAIKNLARQAGLNYMLDPKINYGQHDPATGQVIPQPVVSLRWENLTPDQALGAVLNNYNLAIVEDPKTKISRITIKDPAAPDPLVSTIIQLKYADPTNIVTSVQTALTDKRSKVVSDGRTAQLVVLATEKELVEVNKIVAQLDLPTKQVLIEAKLVETSKAPNSTHGIDWSGTLQQQHITFGNNALPGMPATPATGPIIAPGGAVIPAVPASPGTIGGILGNPGLIMSPSAGPFFSPSTAFLNADGVSAVLSFLNSDVDARFLSTPRAVTLDNNTAILSVTRAQPIFATTAGTQGSPGGSQVAYTNVGTILRVTPHISANDTIQLKVVPEVSDVFGVATKTVAGVVNQADIFDVRRIETQVLIPSGNTLVMGGLVSDSTTKGNIKVPVLGDIPFLGALFRQESKAQDKKNLIIFITPTIVQSEDFQPTVSDFLKNKLPSDNTSDFGPWDSGKPQDWSKLLGGKSSDTNPSDMK